MKKKGLRTMNCWPHNNPEEVKYSIGYTVNNIETLCTVLGGYLKYQGTTL